MRKPTKMDLDRMLEIQKFQCRIKVRQEILRIEPDLDAITLFARADYICSLMDPLSLLLQMEMSDTFFDELYHEIPWLESERV